MSLTETVTQGGTTTTISPSPDPATAIGCSTTGSSEACMLGGLALKWQWKKRREAQGKPTDKPNFVCGPVQVCWAKFARYFDVEMRQVPLSGDERAMLNAFLDAQRDTLEWKCSGLTPEQLKEAASPPSRLSLLGLLQSGELEVTAGWDPAETVAVQDVQVRPLLTPPRPGGW